MIGVGAWGAPGCSFSVPSANVVADANRTDGDIDARPIDGPVDAIVPLGPWTDITLVSGLNTAGSEDDPTLTGDMLEIYFDRNSDIFVATRTSASAAWSTPQALSQVNSGSIETTPEITLDGLELFFASTRATGSADIFVATRPNRQAMFGAPQIVTELNSGVDDVTPTPLGNAALVMYMSSGRTGGPGLYDIYRTTRPTRAQAWATPVLIPEASTAGTDTEPSVDLSETTMYLSADGAGGRDIYEALRSSTSDPWGSRTAVAELNSLGTEEDPWLSPDGHTMYFMSSRAGTADIYMATR